MYEASSQKQEPLFDEIRLESRDIKVRTITIDDLKQCLRAGYDDFQARPISIPFQIAFYFLVALTIVLFASGQGMRYLAFPMVAGFNLIGPIIAIGFFAMSRQREQGQPMRWGTAFSFVHSSAFAPILALAIIMMVLFVAWLYVAEMIFFGVFGNNPPETLSGILQVLFNTRSGGLADCLWQFCRSAVCLCSAGHVRGGVSAGAGQASDILHRVKRFDSCVCGQHLCNAGLGTDSGCLSGPGCVAVPGRSGRGPAGAWSCHLASLSPPDRELSSVGVENNAPAPVVCPVIGRLLSGAPGRFSPPPECALARKLHRL